MILLYSKLWLRKFTVFLQVVKRNVQLPEYNRKVPQTQIKQIQKTEIAREPCCVYNMAPAIFTVKSPSIKINLLNNRLNFCCW